MISSFRNFAKTKFAGLLVFLMIIPFVFWGMGSMFSSGNTNTIAKVNERNISTQDFIDYLKDTGIPDDTIRKNLKNNIIEELLSNLISTTILELEVDDYNLKISEKTLLKKIKTNKNFLDENGNFQRIKYEKFLLENNQSAPNFELRLRGRELQKNLFDFIGAGTISSQFLVDKLFKEENKKLEIQYINLENFYKKRDAFTDDQLIDFLKENQNELKIDYIDFNYAVLNPKNLIGIDEFNEAFFEKIDQIEADIANGIQLENILSDFEIDLIEKKDFKISSEVNEIEKKIFDLRNNKYDIFESGNNYILYQIKNIDQRKPDISDGQTRKEITELVYQKYKFEYNNKLLKEIRGNNFDENNFDKFGKNNIQTTTLNSVKDNKKFDINAVEVLYSLPENSFTLINDEENNIYLAKVKKYQINETKMDNDILNQYKTKQNSNIKNTILKSYDLYLNKKYEVILNQKTIERVKNFFQ